MQSTRRVAVVGGNRIPFARSDGAYATRPTRTCSPPRWTGWSPGSGWPGERVGEVAAGAVLKHSRDFNLTRESVLGSRLDPHTPAYDVQQACGTGLEAAILVANKIALGQIDVGIAGGVDTTSDAPLARQRGHAADPAGAQPGPDPRRPAQGRRRAAPAPAVQPEIPRNAEPRTGLSMGEHAALTALQWASTGGAGRAGARLAPAASPPRTSAGSSTTWSRRTSA